jgi:hypothetical protein
VCDGFHKPLDNLPVFNESVELFHSSVDHRGEHMHRGTTRDLVALGAGARTRGGRAPSRTSNVEPLGQEHLFTADPVPQTRIRPARFSDRTKFSGDDGSPTGVMQPFLSLIRRYCIEYPDELLASDYVLRLGPRDFTVRDRDYLTAVQSVFDEFPGLTATVCDVVNNGQRLAIRTMHHGASTRHGMNRATWNDISLFRWDGERLTETIAVQDFESQRQQLASGISLSPEAPLLAPWDTPIEAPDELAERAVHEWLDTGEFRETNHLSIDDSGPGSADPVIFPEVISVNELFSAGRRVAFKATFEGTYRGALDVPETLIGSPVTVHLAGIVRVDDDGVMHGNLVRDRQAMRRELMSRVRAS